MSLPEGYLPRKGDELLIRVRVKSDTQLNDDCYAEVVGREHIKLFLMPADIHALYCRCWNEGDRVMAPGTGPASVIATCVAATWVKSDRGTLLTHDANVLELYVEPSTGSQALVGDDDPVS